MSDSSAHQQRIETRLLKSADTRPERDAAYNEALEAEDCAAIAEDEAAAALWSTPAESVAGVAAKLDAILNRGQPSPTSPDEPWSQLRIILADLLRIEATLDPPRGSTAGERQPALQNG
uniref:hypothetical protein n=1 Tax=Sinorhizobium chiapasense TaxID=501572 RepID=UPI002FE23AFA